MSDEKQAGKWINVKNPFALIIGIDIYSHATKLKGAAADADRFASFLEEQVRVKKDRIINLRNEGATRTNIVKAFRSLWENPFINHDDPIIIYFAGHGCKINPPACWETGGQDTIEGIFSYDVEPEESSTRSIFPIPDRTIGLWLDILSHEKGNNITLIFDCCHSASGARAADQVLVRAQEFHGSIPDYIDKESFSIKVPPEFLYQGSRSYVLLAACSSKEYAKEEGGKGKFTEKLLKALAEPDAHDLSYVELMRRIKSFSEQTPQCEGHFKNRVLFSNIMKIDWGLFQAEIDLKNESKERTYLIHAGSIQGVDENSLFDLYETAAIDTQMSKPVCRLRAQNVHSLRTIGVMEPCEAQGEMTAAGFARQVCCGKPLKVHFSPAFLGVVSERSVTHHADIDGSVEVVTDARSADFTVDVADAKNKTALFTTSLKHVTPAGHEFRFPDPVLAVPESISRVLLAASRWKQHLDISSSASWINNVHIEFFPLEPVEDETGNLTLKRLGTSQLNNKDNIVYLDIPPNNDDFYGMTIQNGTALDLHVTIVAFDIDSLAIGQYFSGAIGVDVNGDADAFLPKGKYLTIGYGNSGGAPFMFDVPKEGGNVTVLKVYLTTMPLDLGWLQQESPFSDDISRSSRRRSEVQKRVTSVDPRGATTLVTIVQNGRSSSEVRVSSVLRAK